MLKVFLRPDQLNEPSPLLMASYDSDSDVSDTAHGGTNVVVMHVADNVVKNDPVKGEQRLMEGWRTAVSAVPSVMNGEAKRRIDAVMPLDQQLVSMHEMIGLILRYGGETAKWPEPARHRRAEIERLWDYANSVRDTAAAFTKVPNDPTNDSHWPTRILKDAP